MEMSQLKVLIVEDDLLISESLKISLEILNHKVCRGRADNADTASNFCNKDLPDLALS